MTDADLGISGASAAGAAGSLSWPPRSAWASRDRAVATPPTGIGCWSWLEELSQALDPAQAGHEPAVVADPKVLPVVVVRRPGQRHDLTPRVAGLVATRRICPTGTTRLQRR